GQPLSAAHGAVFHVTSSSNGATGLFVFFTDAATCADVQAISTTEPVRVILCDNPPGWYAYGESSPRPASCANPAPSSSGSLNSAAFQLASIDSTCGGDVTGRLVASGGGRVEGTFGATFCGEATL